MPIDAIEIPELHARCDHCGHIFRLNQFFQRFCSRKCRDDWHNAAASLRRKAGRVYLEAQAAQAAAAPAQPKTPDAVTTQRLTPATWDGQTAKQRAVDRFNLTQTDKPPTPPNAGIFVEKRRR